MTTDQIRTAYRAQPFRPFVLYLADGREIPVAHQEFMLLSPSGRTIVIYQKDDSFNIIDLLLVTDLEFKAPSNGNGKKRRKRGS